MPGLAELAGLAAISGFSDRGSSSALEFTSIDMERKWAATASIRGSTVLAKLHSHPR